MCLSSTAIRISRSFRKSANIKIVMGIGLLTTGCVYSQTSSVPSLTIVSPTSAESFSAGDRIPVVVNVSGGAEFKNGIAVFGRIVDDKEGIMNGAPYTTFITIPATLPPGTYSIVAIGGTTSGLIKSSRVPVKVRSGPTFQKVLVEPFTIRLDYIGGQGFIGVRGITAEGTSVALTSSDALDITCLNSLVAKCDGVVVTALGSGSTSVTVRYGPHAIIVPVTVVDTKRGDLDGDGDVDLADVNVVQSWLGSPTTIVNDARDLNRDGRIDALDLRVLTTLCTLPRCAMQ